MSRVMVHVKCKACKDCKDTDLELPVNIRAAKLGSMIAIALGWKEEPQLFRYQYTIQAQPLGRALRPDETLSQAGLWDGAYFFLNRHSTARYWLQSITGQKYALIAPELTIGRVTPDVSPSADDVIDLSREPNGQSVSRQQVRLTLNGVNWVIESIGDTGPRTFVYQNEIPATEIPPLKSESWQSFTEIKQPYQLKNGVWVRFGNVPMKFCVAQSIIDISK